MEVGRDEILNGKHIVKIKLLKKNPYTSHSERVLVVGGKVIYING